MLSSPAAAQTSWEQFPVSQSRLEFSAPGLSGKPSRGWELKGNSSNNNKVRSFQYRWGNPFAGEGAFAWIALSQIRDSNIYFSTQPQWQAIQGLTEFATRKTEFVADSPALAKTDGLGSLQTRPFQSEGRACLAFGGLTNGGVSSQLLYGEGMASGDTSVRGYYCSTSSGRPLGPQDSAAIMGALKFR
ncbi:MAG: hypothetical protein ACK4FJ_00040 [Ferrovibrio sp.]|uniref:hypothetical protein n=1 Tax=Ferrovibrio sp. TaxID=1917215 RepID=UPI003919CA86